MMATTTKEERVDPRYMLMLISHNETPAVQETIQSFVEHASHRPVRQLCVVDGEDCGLPPLDPLGPWEITQNQKPLGHCKASACAWGMAAEGDGYDFVFWLDANAIFECDFNIGDMAYLTRKHPSVAQVQLPRESAPDGAERMEDGWIKWTKHHDGLPTGPYLAHKSLFRQFSWPSSSRCEQVMWEQLRAAGYAFASMGSGEPLVRG